VGASRSGSDSLPERELPLLVSHDYGASGTRFGGVQPLPVRLHAKDVLVCVLLRAALCPDNVIHREARPRNGIRHAQAPSLGLRMGRESVDCSAKPSANALAIPTWFLQQLNH
jgi:hypothetical protein